MNDEICRTALLTWQPDNWGHCTLYGVHCTQSVQFSTIQKQSESKKHRMIITYRYFSIYNEEACICL
jgi:hypothetical protein